ncbi:universal stress protein [Planomonospora sp. ID67723]|uniref:universal stress protein n=1 Tax=Planomonospora sp. ID67723 TaxID=2738134 RepID=UPI0018C36868|nr:universal stress protein [Planomonospora sp. ID67723]MBG0832443.1 universal stress protein [Planomonospora sp. ID67723]
MGHVVVGVDGSADSLRAVEWAVHEAVRRGLPLRVVHAAYAWLHSPAEAGIEEVRQWLLNNGRQVLGQAMAHAREREPEAVVTDAVVTGDPVGVMVAEAEEAELLVVASRGTGRISSLLLGSVALKVVSQAPCPVVVVRGPVEPEKTFGEVVVGVDGSPASAGALRFAAAEASLRGARLRVILAWNLATPAAEMMPPMLIELGEVEAAWTRVLDEAVGSVARSHPELDIAHQVVTGHPVQTLIDASEAADLVVVGSRGRGALAGLVLGSVSHGVLHHACCPVAVIGSHVLSGRLEDGQAT